MEHVTKKLIVSNWKMSPSSLVEAREILDSASEYLESADEKNFNLVFCPPFIFLKEVGRILKNSNLVQFSTLGAQDIFWEDQGADTGEISGPMLKKLGVEYAIIGHSERRWKLGEPDEIINKKLKAALRNNITPIVCIGERERNNNFKEFLEKQVEATFNDLSSDDIDKCLVAYEPVWAISSIPGARPDTPESALESIRIIKNTLIENCKLRTENLPKVLYGGSVNSSNILDFISQDEIAGVLVGSASVSKEEFIKLLSKIK